MSRRRTKSDILSGLSIASKVFSKFHKMGVTDADWQRILSDDVYAARVAAIIRSADPELDENSFPELLKTLMAVGTIDTFDSYFKPAYGFMWTNKGDHHSGEFYVYSPERSDRNALTYSVGNVAIWLEDEAQRVGKGLRHATAYDLAYFAGHGWDLAVGEIVAFGSSLEDTNGKRQVACLRGGVVRQLTLEPADKTWGRRVNVLCVW